MSERVKTGEGKDATWEAKYEMRDLLDPAFKLPRPDVKPRGTKAPAGMDGIAMMMALAKQPKSGVRLWKPIEPV